MCLRFTLPSGRVGPLGPECGHASSPEALASDPPALREGEFDSSNTRLTLNSVINEKPQLEYDQRGHRRRVECLVIALVITFASLAIPYWFAGLTQLWFDRLIRSVFKDNPALQLELYYGYFDILALLFGLVLVLSSPKRYGLCIGRIREHWKKVVLVLGVSLSIALIGAMLVPLPKWMGERVGVWLISPLAQDLVFAGFLYTIIQEAFPGNIHPRVPMQRALPITAAFFSLWHLPNLVVTDTWFVCLQLTYTFLAFTFVGLSRQWTGSFLYGTVAHSIANFFGWWFVVNKSVGSHVGL